MACINGLIMNEEADATTNMGQVSFIYYERYLVLCQESRHIDLRYFYLKPLPHFVWLGIRNDQSKGVIDHL